MDIIIIVYSIPFFELFIGGQHSITLIILESIILHTSVGIWFLSIKSFITDILCHPYLLFEGGGTTRVRDIKLLSLTICWYC